MSSIPGIDEAMAFARLIGQIEKMDYDIVVFDTAPTGHTLRLLNFPNLLEKGLARMLELKKKFSDIASQVSLMFGQKDTSEEDYDLVVKKLTNMKKTVEKVKISF